MSKMELSKEEIRLILHVHYLEGKNASQATELICDVYGPDTLSIRVAQHWFKRFRSGVVEVKDAPRSGRPVVENVAKIMEIVESDRHVSTRNIAQELHIGVATVSSHLQKAGFKKKVNVWVPHELTQKNLMDRISICESLLNRNKIDPFLERMVTGDVKWITYIKNIKPKRSWKKRDEPSEMVTKPGLTAEKVLLCVWWDYKGIIHHELLSYGQMLNSDLCCQQLDSLKQAIEQKRPELTNGKDIVFYQDNARSHTSSATRQKIRDLGWEVLLHPSYSPDLSPSDYHLFRSLQNTLGNTQLASREICENWLSEFFANRDEDFYERGIMRLPSKWQQVVEQNGAYLTF